MENLKNVLHMSMISINCFHFDAYPHRVYSYKNHVYNCTIFSQHCTQNSSYTSMVIIRVHRVCLIFYLGAVILWCYWPSFNASPLATAPFQQNRALANTYFSMMSATVTVFMVSPLVEKKGKASIVSSRCTYISLS